LTLLRTEKGELDVAEAEALEVISTAATAGLAITPQVVAAYLAMARLALDRGIAGEVDDWLSRVAEVVAIAPEPPIRLAAALVLAARREDAGNREQALAGLRATAAHPVGWSPPRALREQWMTTEAALTARLGDSATARHLLNQLQTPVTDAGALALARVLLMLGRNEEALTVRARIEVGAHARARVDTALLDARLALAVVDEEAATGWRTPWRPPRRGVCAGPSSSAGPSCTRCSSGGSSEEPSRRPSRSNSWSGHPTHR
jgi:hypothetical protein